MVRFIFHAKVVYSIRVCYLLCICPLIIFLHCLVCYLVFVYVSVAYGPWQDHVRNFWDHRYDNNLLFLSYEDLHQVFIDVNVNIDDIIIM